MQWLSLVKLLRVQRLIRVNARARNRAQEAGHLPRHVVVQKAISILKLLLVFVLWAHLCGCFYWFIGRIQPRVGSMVSWVDKLFIEKPELESAEYAACPARCSLYSTRTRVTQSLYGCQGTEAEAPNRRWGYGRDEPFDCPSAPSAPGSSTASRFTGRWRQH